MAKDRPDSRAEHIRDIGKAMRSEAFRARPAGGPPKSHVHRPSGTKSRADREAIADSASEGAW